MLRSMSERERTQVFNINKLELDGVHPSFDHDLIDLLFEELLENQILAQLIYDLKNANRS